MLFFFKKKTTFKNLSYLPEVPTMPKLKQKRREKEQEEK